VQYKGDGKALIEKLQGVCEVLENEESAMGFSSLKIHIERNEDVRSVVALVNDTVEMRQFIETMPSMNDIFIRAVNG
jgi:ABC-2 type transport system ATP-binding protein